MIAAMLMDQDAILRAIEHVDDTMFYREGNRRIFRAMVAIAERGDVVDPLTLAEELVAPRRARGRRAARTTSASSLDVVPTAANVEYHARIVKEKALLRRLIEISHGDRRRGATPGTHTAAELLDEAEHRDLPGQPAARHAGLHARQGADVADDGAHRGAPEGRQDGHRRAERLQRSRRDDVGLPERPTSIIVAARPSMGKTAFVLNIAQHAAIEQNIPVAFFSLEMSKEALVQRMLTAEARIDAQKLRKGCCATTTSRAWRARPACSRAAPIWIDDSAGITLLEIRSRRGGSRWTPTSDWSSSTTCNSSQGPPNAESRQQEISSDLARRSRRSPRSSTSRSSRSRSSRARRSSAPASTSVRSSPTSANRAPSSRTPTWSCSSTARRSTRARTRWTRTGIPVEGRAEIIVGKQRNGPIGTVHLFFHKEYTRFENYTARAPGA